MTILITLILATIFLCIQLKKILDTGFNRRKVDYERIRLEYDTSVTENKILREDNSALGESLEATIALYDITKEICKSLDEDQVFANFYDLINRDIKVDECKFIKDESELSQYNNYTVLPLEIGPHKRGYLVADGIKEQDKERFHILAGQFLLGIKRAVLYQKVQEMAITDSLTTVSSRRHLLERLNEELGRSRKFNYHFSFLMIDIDCFKDSNDRYGHLVGDAVLKEVSKAIRENIRQIDLVGRYGGEEFSVILSETDRQGAKFAAERIRLAIEGKSIKAYDEDLKVTISIGISVFPEDALDKQMLIDRADMALYQAKNTGRNKVCVFSVSSSS